MEEMQECVKLIQHRLPRALETHALIGPEPVQDKVLQRKHAALCDHVGNFSAVQMVTQSRVWLGDLVSTFTFANIRWTLISITLTLEDKVASLKSIGVRNILNDNNHLVVGSTGAYSLPDVQFVVERVYKDSASCDISLFMTTSVNNLQVVDTTNNCYPPDPRFGLSELVAVTNPQPPNKGVPPVREITKVSSQINTNPPGCSRSRGHIQIHCSLDAGVMYTLEGVLQPVAEGDLSAAGFFDDTSQTTLTTLSQASTSLFCCVSSLTNSGWLIIRPLKPIPA